MIINIYLGFGGSRSQLFVASLLGAEERKETEEPGFVGGLWVPLHRLSAGRRGDRAARSTNVPHPAPARAPPVPPVQRSHTARWRVRMTPAARLARGQAVSSVSFLSSAPRRGAKKTGHNPLNPTALFVWIYLIFLLI